MLCIRGGPAITYGACRRYVRNLLRAVLTLFGLPSALLPALPHPPKKVPLDFLKLPHPQEAILRFQDFLRKAMPRSRAQAE